MKIVYIFCVLLSLCVPVSALEIEPPEVPAAGRASMPETTTTFGDGLWELLQKTVSFIRPEFADASQKCLSIIISVLILSLFPLTANSNSILADVCGAVVISAILVEKSHSMISLATEMIREISDYAKLLFPVMTTAMAAQGGVTTSAALYTGTAFLNAVLSGFISQCLIPFVYLFLAFAVGNCAVGEDILKKIKDMLKSLSGWVLKIILTVFTTYMSITGVVSGTTDAAALKAAKITISSVVPIVGGIMSDASEAVLVSAALMKNAAGVYGILAILALFLEPFLRIGTQYLLLKATGTVCSILGTKSIAGLIEDFSSAMGLLLAMTGTCCLMILISTICFMKGVG